MNRNNAFRSSVALAAVTALLSSCSESSADTNDKADKAPSSSATSEASTDESSAPAEEAELPDGVLALPGPDAGEDYASLAAGRYRVPLGATLAFDVDVADKTSAHDDGLFLATGSIVLKTEIAGEAYGVPADPCIGGVIEPVGPTVDDLVEAMRDLPIYRVTRPEPVELGGATGFSVQATVPRTYDASRCDSRSVQLPGNPSTPVAAPPPYIGRWWVLDFDGQRVVVQQNCWGCNAEDLDRAATAPESITFTPTP